MVRLSRRTALSVLAAAALPELRAQRNLSGAPQVQLALESLAVLGRVLMIAAHPDDENTAALAYFARGRKMDAAYLSLTRGEGGQNLIGSEQGELLGMIRTQELLAARRVDGARQFFTRAIDFGYSKTAEETLGKWGRDNILRDVVWVIRNFRPDVIISVFSGTPRDGHGHHQSAALLAREGFRAAADPARFPEQLKHVAPWQAKRLLFNVFYWSREAQEEAAQRGDRVSLPIGEYNPLLGCSYAEIAGMSRSEHRSQGMGSPERKGETIQYLLPVEGEPARDDPFAGIDTSWRRVPGGEEIGRMLEGVIASFDARQPERIIPDLLAVRRKLIGRDDFWANEKRRALEDVVAQCAGLWLDAACPADRLIPGRPGEVIAEALLRRSVTAELRELQLESATGANVAANPAKKLPFNQPVSERLRFRLPETARPSHPYWLEQPHDGVLYRVEDVSLLGLPESPPPFQVRFRVRIEGEEIEFVRPVIHRFVDPVYGERTRTVVVAPPATVEFAQPVWIFPAQAPKTVAVEVHANDADIRGTVALKPPSGWQCEPEQASFALSERDERQVLEFRLTPPPAASRSEMRAVAQCGAMIVTHGMHTLSYPHFPPTVVFLPSRATVVRADIRMPVSRVGYVMGAGDGVADALRELGCEVVLLDDSQLGKGDLRQYEAIITGVRAFNVRPALVANMPRLLEFAQAGGTLLVQYNVLDFRPNPNRMNPFSRLGPYPIQLGRARIAVEDAPVRILHADSPLLHTPNRIGPEDFMGWVQERGLYFPTSWDERYQTLWESSDPGEPPLAGGTLYTRLGEGAYVFSCYSWFRQLPAGVAGAFRIFANLLGAAKSLR